VAERHAARLGDFTRVSLVDASPHDPAVAYLAANRFQLGDLRPMLYKTRTTAAPWTKITAGIPGRGVHARVREDPVRRGLLYAGTERGVWVSFDDGARWQSLKRNLPPVPVHDLVVKEGDLVVATHGRSFYVMDDLSALRQVTAQTAAAPVHLYRPRDAHRVNWGGGGGRLTAGNPPSGAAVYYSLAAPNQELALEVLDPRGRLVRRFTSRMDPAAMADSLRGAARADSLRADSARAGRAAARPDTAVASAEAPPGDDEEQARRRPRVPRVPNKAGLNRFVWDLREADAERFEGMILWAGATGGAMVPPGTYTVRLAVAGRPALAQPLVVRADPRARATPADVEATVALQRRVLERVSAANLAVRTVRNVRAAVAARTAGLPAADRAAFAALARPMLDSLARAEEAIYQVRNQSSQDPLNYPIRLNNRLAALAGVVASADPRPTRQSYVVFDALSRELDVELAAVRRALGAPLAAVNAELARRGSPRGAERRRAAPAERPRLAADDAADDDAADEGAGAS
jgi:hypothetical protein